LEVTATWLKHLLFVEGNRNEFTQIAFFAVDFEVRFQVFDELLADYKVIFQSDSEVDVKVRGFFGFYDF